MHADGFPPFDGFIPGDRGGLAGAPAGDAWPPFPPLGPPGFSQGESAPGHAGKAETPKLPCASPVGDIANPLGEAMDPRLTTPGWTPAGSSDFPMFSPMLGPGSKGHNALGQLDQIDTWAWEMGSDVGSVPSAWSKATSSRTGQSSASRMSSTTGHDGLIPGLIEGQRLQSVKPANISARGGKVIVSLRKEVPKGYWDTLSVVLVNLPVSLTLKPTGIKKGRKLCIEVPAGMKPEDYDVRLKFGEKIIHGSIPLAIRDDSDCDAEMDDDDDLQDLANSFRSLVKS